MRANPAKDLTRLIHLIMTADIEQNDFLGCDQKGQGDPVVSSEADCVAAGEFAAQRMQCQLGLERVCLQITEHLGEAWLQLRMSLEKLAGLAQKLLWRDNAVHYSDSSASRAFSRSSTVLNFSTLPFFTSSRDARTRA